MIGGIMLHKILVGYDGSAASHNAFEFALDLAKKYGAELHLLAVTHPPEFGGEEETEAVIENSHRHHFEMLQNLKSGLKGIDSLQLHTEVTIGHPAEQLVIYAEKHGIDHIVVGHRGRSVFERWLLGSIARQVIAYARCAVTVVRK